MLSLLYSLHDALRIVTPGVLLAIGAVLGGYSRHYRLTVEQRVKNRQLSEVDARRAIAFFRWSGPAMTILGVVLLVFAWSDTGR